MNNTVHPLLAGPALFTLGLLIAPLPSAAATWMRIQGQVRLQNETPVCAMVLANGQFMFSCDGTGAYDLNVPLDANGQINLFAFADGCAPFRTNLGPGGGRVRVRMGTAARHAARIAMTPEAECAGTPNWVRIRGDVESYGSKPLCAMVLANGQHTFSCDESIGTYDLTVPVDENGQVTVFGFADGFQPYRDTFVAPICGVDSSTPMPQSGCVGLTDVVGITVDGVVIESTQLSSAPSSSYCEITMQLRNTTSTTKVGGFFHLSL